MSISQSLAMKRKKTFRVGVIKDNTNDSKAYDQKIEKKRKETEMN